MEFDTVKDLRYDMVIGTTCFSDLLQDYFNGETENADKLAACGSKAVFLVMPVGEADRSGMLKLRYEIEDRLTAEVLGKRDPAVRSESYWEELWGAIIYTSICCFTIPLLLWSRQAVCWGNIPILSIWPNFGRRVVW